MSNPVSPSIAATSGSLLVLATTLMLAGGIATADTRSSGHVVTTSVTKLDLAALQASAFGDAEETR